jgi:hypothetical protein
LNRWLRFCLLNRRFLRTFHKKANSDGILPIKRVIICCNNLR